jgi:LPXTG-site transpeptidase (sortase) family protein
MFNHLTDFLRQKDHLFIKDLLIFAGIFFGVFILCFTVLSAFGFIPTEFKEKADDGSVASKLQESTLEGLGLVVTPPSEEEIYTPTEQGELPYRIAAASIGLDATIVRPASTSYTVLNNALAKGAVYYPGSGLAGNGNMFVFGHSTSYSYVNNKAYQVFNNVKNLKEGDEIKVYGQDKIYIYKVRLVKLVNANEELVSFTNNRDMLTLSTCNSFGQKSDRYVAEADFVRSVKL